MRSRITSDTATADVETQSGTPTEGALHSGRLGVLGIVFFVVAAAAPLVGMTGGLPVAIVAGNGAAAPGSFVLVGITLLLFSVGYAAMSHRVTNAGAFYAYVGRGLGSVAGVGSAFVSLVAYFAIQLGIYGFFGATLALKMKSSTGLDLPWWLWAGAAWMVVLVLSCLSVDVGAKFLGVLMGCEIVALVVMSIAVLVKGGPSGIHVGDSFSLGKIFAGGLTGGAGIALAFAFASFIGFEATAIYGEEAKDPKKTVPRATYVAVICITLLFALSAFAVVTGLGSADAVAKTAKLSNGLVEPASVVFGVADQYVGSWLGNVMGWLVLSSLFAGLLAFQNSSARYLLALGRGGVLPRPLSTVNKAGAPAVASATTSVIGIVVVAYFAISGKDPVSTLFYWTTALAVLAILLVEALVCVAVISFFRREGGGNLWNALIAPTLAFLGLAIGFYLLFSRFGLLAGTVRTGVDPTKQAWGFNTTGWVLTLTPWATLVIGLVVGISAKRNRDRAPLDSLMT